MVFERPETSYASITHELRAEKKGNFTSLRRFCGTKTEQEVQLKVHQKLKDTPWADAHMVIVTAPVHSTISETVEEGDKRTIESVVLGGVQRIQLESHFTKGFVFMQLCNWSVGMHPSREIIFGDEGTLPGTMVIPTLNAMRDAFRMLLGKQFDKEFPPCTIVASRKDGFIVRPT